MSAAAKLPTKAEFRYVVGGNPILVSEGDLRTTGQEIPEAFDWPKRRQLAMITGRALIAVPRTGGVDPAFVRKALGLLPLKSLSELAEFADISAEDWGAVAAKDGKVDLLMRAAGFVSSAPAG